MPLLGTKSSPELFQGDCSRVWTFLDHYEATLIIEGMPHFHTPNWPHLKASLLCYFDADIFDEWFFERDLKALHKGKLTEHEHNRYFWAGLSPLFRASVEGRLKQKDPNLNVSIPFPYDEVCKAAEEVLHRDHFDADDLDLLGP
ncbi:hypothetical protein EDD16DRAFT_1693341 [Pisolithus croceorrhizus]|nr:hypothetical protein EDD16DRAFT_1693341 [Pisolithus croceorrhizus]